MPMDTIYIEQEVLEHPRTQRILQRYPSARHIPIERHTDLFNAGCQDFRQQKQNPALILARKAGRRIHATPPGYHVGGVNNYYFSHMLNCVYDCRYCYLQGMYNSANHVVYVNSEDFMRDITEVTQQHDEDSWFFSGYDCDSLAMNPLTCFVEDYLQHFSTLPGAWLELRTKSTQIRSLLSRTPMPNVVVAYSLSPQPIVEAEEHGTPSLFKRLDALRQLQDKGWKVGLRLDPLLYADNFDSLYGDMFDQIFSTLNMAAVHSVSLGVFRLPNAFHRKLVRLYPDARLLAAPVQLRDGLVSYPPETEAAMRHFCLSRLTDVLTPEQFFPCS